MARILAKKINAEIARTPPLCILPLRSFYEEQELRPAYYGIGNYIAAIQISKTIRKHPVILDR